MQVRNQYGRSDSGDLFCRICIRRSIAGRNFRLCRQKADHDWGYLSLCSGDFFCGQTQSVEMLLTWRFFQALGAGVGSVITQTILRDVYTGTERAKLFSIMSGALAFSPAIGRLLLPRSPFCFYRATRNRSERLRLFRLTDCGCHHFPFRHLL